MDNADNPQQVIPTWIKHRALEIAGWVLVLIGIAALVLPGPGLLCVTAGLALLALRYPWAKRLLRPIKLRALRLASKGVQTWPRIIFSTLGGLSVIAVGIIWGIGFPAPGWWPLEGRWWLAGGWGTGATLIASGGLALGMILYSFKRFNGQPPL